jgi:drug/metabolite transporter (DMT)-like permease
LRRPWGFGRCYLRRWSPRSSLYAVATALWVWILTDTPLSRAYPFALLGAVLVPVASVILFGERLNWTYPVGLAMVCAGVYLCVR